MFPRGFLRFRENRHLTLLFSPPRREKPGRFRTNQDPRFRAQRTNTYRYIPYVCKMPPFGFDNDRLGLLQMSFSEEIDSRGDDGIGSEALKNLLQRFEEESVPIELSSALQDLFKKAGQFGDKVRETNHHIVMGKAVDSSIRIELTEVLDQVALLFEVEGDKRRVVAALTAASVKQALHYFQKLESMVLEADTKKLAPFLHEFSEMEEEYPPIRVSLLSRALAFEFMAGKMDTLMLSSLKVKATPYLVVKSDVISAQSCLLHKYSDCKVKIDYCSHKKLFSSAGSGVTGEAIVRIYVNPGKEVKIPKEGTVWSDSGDCDRLTIAEVRAVQTNAYPRNVQTRLDLYLSSMYGLSGFIVTMKMQTYKSFNNEIPDFDIQLIMEPPSTL